MPHFLAKTSILFLLTGIWSSPSWANAENSHRQIVDETWQVINRSFIGGENYDSQAWLQTRWNFLLKTYTSKEAAYEAIHAMLMRLNDPETRLLDSKQFASIKLESDGELMGVGLIDFSVDTNEKTKELRVVTTQG